MGQNLFQESICIIGVHEQPLLEELTYCTTQNLKVTFIAPVFQNKEFHKEVKRILCKLCNGKQNWYASNLVQF